MFDANTPNEVQRIYKWTDDRINSIPDQNQTKKSRIINYASDKLQYSPIIKKQANENIPNFSEIKYKPHYEILGQLAKVYEPVELKELIKEIKVQKILLKSEKAQHIFTEAIMVDANTSIEVQKICDEARDRINQLSDLTRSQNLWVIKYIQDNLHRTQRIRSETKTAERKKSSKKEVKTLKIVSPFYQKQIEQIGLNNYIVKGRINQIEMGPDGSKSIVEIKNRMHKLLQIPEAKLIKIQVDMQLVNLTQARIEEECNNEISGHNLSRDDRMWTNEILPGLKEFCHELNQKIS